jgi:Luciferase
MRIFGSLCLPLRGRSVLLLQFALATLPDEALSCHLGQRLLSLSRHEAHLTVRSCCSLPSPLGDALEASGARMPAGSSRPTPSWSRDRRRIEWPLNGLDFNLTLTSSLVSSHSMQSREEAVMGNEQRPSEWITEQVTSWPGVVAGPGRRGEFAFNVGGREIGHLHGDQAAHFGFPKGVWRTLFEDGRIDYHPIFPGKPGFGARKIETEADVEDVIALFRINYERVVSRHGLPIDAAA